MISMWFISYTVGGGILKLFASLYLDTFLILIRNTMWCFSLKQSEDLHLFVACTCMPAQIILFIIFIILGKLTAGLCLIWWQLGHNCLNKQRPHHHSLLNESKKLNICETSSQACIALGMCEYFPAGWEWKSARQGKKAGKGKVKK